MFFFISQFPGLGKTYQALAVADFYREDWPLLIVSTASMRNVWQKKVIELFPNVPVHNIRVLDSKNDSITDAQIVICSYTGLENFMKKLTLVDFGVIIFDESHFLKNIKSNQTKNASQLSEKARRVILLTGTPALSRPAELFTQLEIIDKKFTSWFHYTTRYCEGKQSKYGWNSSGCENTDELNVILCKKFMIRRTKQNVMSELGEKQREIVPLKNIKLSTADTNEMRNFAEGFHNSGNNKVVREQVMRNWNQSTAELKAKSVG